ncbi:MAG: lipid-A-disaccharide synthase, partial [Acidobacteriota bacterium]
MTSILIVAGEHSGERYGADVVREWKKNHPEVKFFGIGGKRMSEEGVELVSSVGDLSAVGIFEVLTHILHFKKIFGRLRKEIQARRPEA